MEEQRAIENVFHEEREVTVEDLSRLGQYVSSREEYERLYRESIEQPEQFWAKAATTYEWMKPWEKVLEYEWAEQIKTQWFVGAQTNLSVNCLDRHLAQNSEKTALIWEGNESSEQRRFSFKELSVEVNKLANALRGLGVGKGDRVAIYMGMVPELAMSLLACARIGAIHNVVFGGFSAASLQERMLDCQADFLITADGLYRGEKTVALKPIADQAMAGCATAGHELKACLVLQRTGEPIAMQEPRDHWWHDCVSQQASECTPEVMDAEDPLFLLYTSGSTGKPKGVMHTTAGYMVYVGLSFQYVFASRPDDIYWCTADIGWVTGHSYGVYGPLLNGVTTLMFEGVPHYPQPDRFWDMIERHRVTTFYTAPTALRALMRQGDEWLTRHDLSSLKLLGSVGEPINPAAWMWYFEKVGGKRCPIIDTWWQTETGGIMVTTLPGATPMKPSSAGLPFFGVAAEIIDESGQPCAIHQGGYFVITQPWPAMIRGVYGQPERVKQTYMTQFPGKYLSGDGAYRDEDGYIWFLGRLDDVLNVSGHRMGTAELESALVKHDKIVEAAVVGFPHPVKGQGIFAFVTLAEHVREDRNLRREIVQHLTKEIGPIAKPDHLIFTQALPKTRSGKIMRRILKKIAAGETKDLGDTSTLADAQVIEMLIAKLDQEEQ